MGEPWKICMGGRQKNMLAAKNKNMLTPLSNSYSARNLLVSSLSQHTWIMLELDPEGALFWTSQKGYITKICWSWGCVNIILGLGVLSTYNLVPKQIKLPNKAAYAWPLRSWRWWSPQSTHISTNPLSRDYLGSRFHGYELIFSHL